MKRQNGASRTHSTVYVAREDREELGRLLHITDDASDTWLWRLSEHLLFGTSFDEDTGELLLDHRTLGLLGDRSHRTGKFSAYRIVADYQVRTGVRVTLSSANALAGKARAVAAVEFPNEVLDIAQRMRRTQLPLSGRIALDTGEQWNPSARRTHRLQTREDSLEACASVENPDAIRLLQMLNEGSSNRWAKVDGLVNDLRSAAEKLDPERREYALNVIAKIEVQPTPFFRPVERTSRIYPVGTTVLGLPRELRKEMVRLLEWRSLDLRSAQLAIVANLWEIESLQRFLQTGQSFWMEMLNHLHLGDEEKPVIKNALYALTFGESERKSKERFVSSFVDGGALWGLWRSHPLISDLYRARKRVIDSYQRAGGAHDAYGKWWPVQGFHAENESGQTYQSSNARSVMATVAQSYELKLLSPVIDILEGGDRRVRLMFWLHDGLTVSIPENRRYVVQQMQDAVREQAVRLGIETELVEE